MQFDYRSYWNTRLQGDFGLESVGYLGLGRQFNKWMYRVRRVNFKRTVRRFTTGLQFDVLDIGVGSGFYVQLWRAMGVTLTGIDISENAVRKLSEMHSGCKFYTLDVAAEAMNIGRYDVISCFDVLFHIVDDDKLEFAIENISNCLKNDGLFIFTDNFLQGEEKRLEHHVSRTLSHYEDLLQKKGFAIIYRAPVFYLMNYPVDTDNRTLHRIWSVLLRIVPGREVLGYAIGIILFTIDVIVTRFLKEGTTTEIMVCRKRNA